MAIGEEGGARLAPRTTGECVVDRITNPPARTEPTKLAFHASRIIIDAGVLLVMAAMSLTFVTSETTTVDSLEADALPVVLLLIPIFIVTLIPNHTTPIPMPLGWASLVLGIAAFPYSIVKYLDASNLARTLGGSVGFGARLLIFGAFVTLAGIGVSLTRNLLHLPSRGTYPNRPPAPERPMPSDPGRRAARPQTSGASPQPGQRTTARPRPTEPQPQRQAPAPRTRPAPPTDPRRGQTPDER